MTTTTKPFKEKFTKTFVPSNFYSLLPLALICLYFYFHSFAPIFTSITHRSSLYASPPLRKVSSTKKDLDGGDGHHTSFDGNFTEEKRKKEKPQEKQCDYFNGNWVHDKRAPLYNGTTCSDIKKSQNCIVNGRPDSSYLYWRWKPSECDLPIFEPNTFLKLISNMVLDITKLALLRPDGHAGAYMNPFPFAKRVPKDVQNDCVHWCLPGPIDTWNEILHIGEEQKTVYQAYFGPFLITATCSSPYGFL